MDRNYAEIADDIYSGIKSYIRDRYNLDTHSYVRVEVVYRDLLVVIPVGIGGIMILHTTYTYISILLGFTISHFARANMITTSLIGLILFIVGIIKTFVDIEMGECEWWDKLMRHKIHIGRK